MFLDNYSLSYSNMALCLVTGVTGVSYGIRHWEKSSSVDCSNFQAFGHRVIAVLDCIPVIGALASILEYVAFWLSGLSSLSGRASLAYASSQPPKPGPQGLPQPLPPPTFPATQGNSSHTLNPGDLAAQAAALAAGGQLTQRSDGTTTVRGTIEF